MPAGTTASHGVAPDGVRFGVATWFTDVLVRFGYDLPEHEHPWDGEWIDDAFEAAAVDLRATGSKLLLALEALEGQRAAVVEPGGAAASLPLAVDLVVAYLGRLVRGLTVALPCCYGVEGRALLPVRGAGPDVVAGALTELDPRAAAALRPPAELQAVLAPGFATASRELYPILDATGDRPTLPGALARTRAASAAVTADAIDEIDRALAAACPWLDGVLAALQRAVAARAEDGEDLLDRWGHPDWAVLRPATPALSRHLPPIA